MARMYPDHPLGGTKSNAERKVFYALKDTLSNDYIVLHSVPIYRRPNKNGPLLDGEIDFLVLHPDKGIVTLEVKGGGIEFNGDTGGWASTSFDGTKFKIKNPYEQSKTYCYDLLSDIKNHPATRKFSYPHGHAVWFPDIDLIGRDLGISPELKGITLGSSDLERVPKAIAQLFKNTLGQSHRKGPGQEGMKTLRKFLAPSWKIPINLSRKITDDKKSILEATRSQYKVLALIERFNRATISGPAGSGKTFLAIEKARRIVENNPEKRVVIVCFNVILAQFLKQIIPHSNQIDVFNFHGLCIEFCKRAHLDIPVPDPQIDQRIFFKNVLPDSLLDALILIENRYDALIVDEGQDFENNWWIPLQELLDDPDEGMFYIFFDDNQKLYGKKKNLPLSDPPFSLSENCRNTKQIHKKTMKYYRGEIKPEAIGPEGQPPEIVKINAQSTEKNIVTKVVTNLLRNEKVIPSDITILTPHRESNSIWNIGDYLANCPITWQRSEQGMRNNIFCSTIHSFKGLESPVVILTETDAIRENRKSELLYVATSRANSHLIIIKKN